MPDIERTVEQLTQGIDLSCDRVHIIRLLPPLQVLVRIHYDPDRPEADDDQLRLFTTEDEGGMYDTTVDLASSGDILRDGEDLLVLFRDVVADEKYSCFLDLGGTEGGYLLFFRRLLTRKYHVDGLPQGA